MYKKDWHTIQELIPPQGLPVFLVTADNEKNDPELAVLINLNWHISRVEDDSVKQVEAPVSSDDTWHPGYI